LARPAAIGACNALAVCAVNWNHCDFQRAPLASERGGYPTDG
jgi:hypothetical protein